MAASPRPSACPKTWLGSTVSTATSGGFGDLKMKGGKYGQKLLKLPKFVVEMVSGFLCVNCFLGFSI